MRRLGWSIAVAVVAGACAGDLLVVSAAGGSLPGLFLIKGEASGSDAKGRTAECVLDLIFELTCETRPASGVVEYTGTMGGGVGRTVLEPDGSGVAFFADVFSESEARLLFPDSVELIARRNLGAEGRFWRDLAILGGRAEGDLTAGRWVCSPLDIFEGGWVDTVVVVEGRWWMERLGAGRSEK